MLRVPPLAAVDALAAVDGLAAGPVPGPLEQAATTTRTAASSPPRARVSLGGVRVRIGFVVSCRLGSVEMGVSVDAETGQQLRTELGELGRTAVARPLAGHDDDLADRRPRVVGLGADDDHPIS